MADRIQLRRDTAAAWSLADPVLADGEVGLEQDTAQFKIGNGVTPWSALPYGGLQGATGPAGPPDSYHRHDQVTPADTWTVNHNFGSRPLVSVFSMGGREMWAEVVHASDNQALIYFDAPTAGYAICT